jgi:hypothetical protein
VSTSRDAIGDIAIQAGTRHGLTSTSMSKQTCTNTWLTTTRKRSYNHKHKHACTRAHRGHNTLCQANVRASPVTRRGCLEAACQRRGTPQWCPWSWNGPLQPHHPPTGLANPVPGRSPPCAPLPSNPIRPRSGLGSGCESPRDARSCTDAAHPAAPRTGVREASGTTADSILGVAETTFTH